MWSFCLGGGVVDPLRVLGRIRALFVHGEKVEGLQDSRISQKIRKGKEEISPLSELNPFLFYKSGLQINSKTTNIDLCVEHLL